MNRALITYNTTRYLVRFRRHFIKQLQAAGMEVHALTPPDEYLPELQGMGVKWHSWNLARHGMNPVADLRSALAVRRVAREVQPRALINVTLKAVLYGGLAGAMERVPRRVALVAGLGNALAGNGLLPAFLRPLYRRALELHHGIMVQNSDDEQAVRAMLGMPQANRVLKLAGSGVNLEEFCPRAPTEDPGELTVLMVTRLVWAKGIREYCVAASRLRNRARFLLVGALDSNPDAPSRQEVCDLAVSAGVAVKFDVSDVASEMRRADVFVYPSYYPEGLPRSIIEALATGLPVITTRSPGCREAIEDGKEGFLVSAGDTQDLEAKLSTLLADRDLRVRLAQAARRRAELIYDEQHIAAKMAQFVTGA